MSTLMLAPLPRAARASDYDCSLTGWWSAASRRQPRNRMTHPGCGRYRTDSMSTALRRTATNRPARSRWTRSPGAGERCKDQIGRAVLRPVTKFE